MLLVLFLFLSDCMGQCGYKDCIQFQAIEGNFKVYLHAVLSSHTMKVPASVMLPLCAVEHYTLTSFPLKNIRYL